MLDAVVGIQQRQGLARLRVHGGRREGRAEGVVEVAVLAPVARVALDVEEGAVELAELAGGVVGALGEVFDTGQQVESPGARRMT